MSDYADRYTDKKISEVERELKKTYRTAQKELKEKLADFNRKFAEKNRKIKKELESGLITKKEYQEWLTGQVFVRSQFEQNIRQVTAVMLDCNKQAINIVNNATLDVFAESYNYNAFKCESEIMASFSLYNAQSVARLILGEPDLLPKYNIDKKKDYVWNGKAVNNIIRQGIIQGESVQQITDRLCVGLATKNDNKMRMFARTAIGSAEGAGRQQQMNDAAAMGIEVNKKWIATHDNRTRDSHRAMDGEEIPQDKPFSNGLMFPKDPEGAPAEVYNCRCRMVSIYPKYEDRSKKDWREDATIDGKSHKEWKKFDNYEEWKKWKEEQERIRNKKNAESLNLTDKDIRSAAKSSGISTKSTEMISKSFEKVFSAYEPLRNHVKELQFADNPGIGSASIDGRIITLDQKVFATEENMKNVFKELIKEGHTVNADNPCFMIAHELGHCLESCAVLKQAGIGKGVVGTLQESMIAQKKKELGLKYFVNMGFGNETTKEIYDIIKSEMGLRALDSPSEMVAQAMGQVIYGTKKAPHAEKLIDYVLSLTR